MLGGSVTYRDLGHLLILLEPVDVESQLLDRREIAPTSEWRAMVPALWTILHISWRAGFPPGEYAKRWEVSVSITPTRFHWWGSITNYLTTLWIHTQIWWHNRSCDITGLENDPGTKGRVCDLPTTGMSVMFLWWFLPLKSELRTRPSCITSNTWEFYVNSPGYQHLSAS